MDVNVRDGLEESLSIDTSIDTYFLWYFALLLQTHGGAGFFIKKSDDWYSDQ